MSATTLIPVLETPTGRTVRIDGTVHIGRHPCNHVSLSDPSASRRHASITLTDEGIYVTDNASSNGTYVNGKRIAGSILVIHGDRIRIGRTEMTFRDE